MHRAANRTLASFERPVRICGTVLPGDRIYLHRNVSNPSALVRQMSAEGGSQIGPKKRVLAPSIQGDCFYA